MSEPETPAAVSERMPQRYAVGVEYDGSDYFGWQTQPHAASVQDALERALSTVAAQSIATVAAGRTDTGVHAHGQVVHFDSDAERSLRSWLLGINSNLPDDINALWVKSVSADFHARYSASGRVYEYRILNRPVRSALLRQRVWWVRSPLDCELMRTAAVSLLGKHDFSAFRAAACQSKTAVRELRRLDIVRRGELLIITCEANAFLHHMVRNLVGSLVRVGLGEAPPDWIAGLLAARDRRKSGITAPPSALTLTQVQYPIEFEIPWLSAPVEASLD